MAFILTSATQETRGRLDRDDGRVGAADFQWSDDARDVRFTFADQGAATGRDAARGVLVGIARRERGFPLILRACWKDQDGIVAVQAVFPRAP